MKNQITIKYISGFSKWTKYEKLELISGLIGIDIAELEKYSLPNNDIAGIIDKLSENTVAHFPFPYGLAPNFKINSKDYILPLVTEESSVVAAMAKAAKVWYSRGGFQAKVISTIKKGQIHFLWEGKADELFSVVEKIRGGGCFSM